MTRVALDSNILIYAELEPDSDKGARAADLILRAARDGVVPVQVLGEYLRFVQRRLPAAFAESVRQASTYRTLFLTPPTTSGVTSNVRPFSPSRYVQALLSLATFCLVICVSGEYRIPPGS